MTGDTGLALYTRTASACAAPVIRRYSTSFGTASRLFPRRERAGIATVYALVRIADEIVDGVAAEAGLEGSAQRAALDELERETERAIRTGFSANPIVHAFGVLARETGIGTDLVRAFFTSMRRDLDPVAFTDREYRDYVHGSAEVVGLMCLRVFLDGREVDADAAAMLEEGAARLGAAFQKINFLRDLGHDREALERSYLPGMVGSEPTPAQIAEVAADIRSDLQAAGRAIPLLPRHSRRAVRLATAFFAQLLHRIECTDTVRLAHTRVSVPWHIKLALIARYGLLPVRGAA